MLKKSRERRLSESPTLVIDVGGTHIKVLATGHQEPREIPSGPAMTPDKMVRDVKRIPEELNDSRTPSRSSTWCWAAATSSTSKRFRRILDWATTKTRLPVAFVCGKGNEHPEGVQGP